MADEYIRKQDAVDLVNKISNLDPKAKGGICVSLANLEKADVVPVVHAYWIPQKENYGFKEVLMRCSVCGYLVSRLTGNANFCPNCGAKMDGERKE